MNPIAERLLTGLVDFGVTQLNRIGQKLPARIRVRSWREQLDDYESRTLQQEAVERRQAQEKRP